MKKRNFVKLAVAGSAAAALILTGCSSTPSETPDAGGETGGSTEKSVLTIASIPNYQGSLPAIVEAFEKENEDIDVQLEFVEVDALYTQIRTQLSAGTAPDIFTTFPGNGTPTAMENLAPGGFLADMSDLGFSSKLPTGMDETTMIDGKRYVLPLSLGAIGGIYNMTAMEEAGLEIPDTWSDLLQFCSDAADKGKVAFAYGAQTSWNNQLHAFPLSATLVYGKDPKFTENQNAGNITFSDSAWVDVYERIGEMNEAGCFQPEPLGTPYETAIDLLASGEALSMSSVSSTFAAAISAAPEGTEFLFGAIPATDNPDETWISAGGSGGYSINAAAKNMDAAKRFMEYLGSDEVLAEIAKLQNGLPSIDSEFFETPESLKPVLPYVEAGKTHPYDDQLWPNAKVAATLMEQTQLFIGGQSSIADVLGAMDQAFAEGSEG